MNSGGAQRQLIGLALCIKKLPNYEARLVYYKKNANFYNTQLENLGIDYYCAHSSQSKFNGFRALRSQVKEYQPDLIISFLGESNLFACINRLFCHIPLIVSERNTTIKPTNLDIVRYFLYRWADRIIPNSYSQGKYLCAKHYHLAKKVIPIINFVDTDFYSPKKLETVAHKKQIIVVARVVPQKNVLTFIRALRITIDKGYNNFYIKWIGDLGLTFYVNQCKDAVKELELTEYISFDGVCQDLRTIYHKANALCLPSLNEGTPNVICEAMASGLPILCSNICDNPRYVETNINGFLFNPSDPYSISYAIKTFINTPEEKILEMGKNSRKKALMYFSINKFNAQWHEIIKQLI